MSVKSVLNGCCEVLIESAEDFRRLDREACAYRCELQVDAVQRLLDALYPKFVHTVVMSKEKADRLLGPEDGPIPILGNEQQEETSDGPA